MAANALAHGTRGLFRDGTTGGREDLYNFLGVCAFSVAPVSGFGMAKKSIEITS